MATDEIFHGLVVGIYCIKKLRIGIKLNTHKKNTIKKQWYAISTSPRTNECNQQIHIVLYPVDSSYIASLKILDHLKKKNF